LLFLFPPLCESFCLSIFSSSVRWERPVLTVSFTRRPERVFFLDRNVSPSFHSRSVQPFSGYAPHSAQLFTPPPYFWQGCAFSSALLFQKSMGNGHPPLLSLVYLQGSQHTISSLRSVPHDFHSELDTDAPPHLGRGQSFVLLAYDLSLE